MVLAYSGDPFLAVRAARQTLKQRGADREQMVELGDGLEPADIATLVAQSGLFGQQTIWLDFDAAFKGQAGVKPRNEVLRILETTSADTLVVVIDLNASASRQKTYNQLGEHHHHPTPRFDKLVGWVRQELRDHGVKVQNDVPQTLADLFGEDLPSIAAEIQKLAVLDETLTSDRVIALANRLANRDAFDFIEKTADGDAKAALSICRSLVAQGEAPARVLGAVIWQYSLVARCVGLRDARGRIDAGAVAQTLKVKPFVAKKALGIAAKHNEATLRETLRTILDADVAVKSGKDGEWALESLALKLSTMKRAGRR